MKKFILGLMLAFISILSVNAQVYDAGTIKDNWYIGGDIGTPIWKNTESWQVFNPWKNQQLNAGIYVGKYITPYVGFEGGFTGIFNSGAETNWIDGHNIYFGGVLNVSNLILGYTGKARKIETELIASPGWNHIYKTGEDLNCVTLKGDFRVKYNVSDNFAITVTPEYICFPKVYDNIHRRHNIGINAGVVYKFNSKRGKFPVHRIYDYEEISKLTSTIESLRKSHNSPVTAAVKEFIPEIKYINNSYSILFDKGSDAIGDISKIVNAIKDTKNNITIIGGTSPEGSEEINRNLANARATAVKEALIKAGIDSNRIIISNDYTQQRRATIIISE